MTGSCALGQVLLFLSYYNLFLEMGVTEGLLRQLQQIGETQIGGGLRSGGSGAAAVMKNSMTFKEWYTSEEGKKSPCFATMRGLVVQAVQRFCAALYERGGRLHAWMSLARASMPGRC